MRATATDIWLAADTLSSAPRKDRTSAQLRHGPGGAPSPDADVEGVSPVPAQLKLPTRFQALGFSWCRCGQVLGRCGQVLGRCGQVLGRCGQAVR